ncbi:MAG: hypothetical protein A2Y33_11880 [Spirochaetes bacterium GWF1_51_8]|nr:MAG: hypothetical protein A2Y33_11880 [Spirochaetes bacterium GWF1_51_8]
MKKYFPVFITVIIMLSCAGNPANNDLAYAAKKGDIAAADAALKKGADINFRNTNGETALMTVVAAKNFKFADFLLKASADPNTKDKNHITPLIRAVMNNDIKMVLLLLMCGANESIRDKNGLNAYDWAKQFKYDEIAEMLKRIYKDTLRESFIYSLTEGDVEDIEVIGDALVKYGFKFDYTGFLAKAVELNSLSAVKILVGMGCDIEEESDLGTPLTVACASGRLEIAKFLIDAGADINTVGNPGWNLLMFSINGENYEITELLVEKGVDINHHDWDGVTPIFYAVWKRDIDTIRLLLENGADVTVETKDGESLMSEARDTGDHEIIDLVEGYGAK